MNKRYKKVAVGGTFDKFHDGHKKLLSTAFELGDQIEIGVTSDAFGGLKGDIDSCKERMDNLNVFFDDKSNFKVVPLNDPFGTTIYDEDFDAIVVSPETEPNAEKINEIRLSNDEDISSFELVDIGEDIFLFSKELLSIISDVILNFITYFFFIL